MKISEQIDHLKTLRTNVSDSYQHVLDLLHAGYSRKRCRPALDAWHAAVREYLAALDDADIDPKALHRLGKQHRRRLDDLFEADLHGVDGWKADREIEHLIASYEVACDLRNGHAATRRWLLTRDKRLKQSMRRSARTSERMPTYHPEIAQEVH